MAFGRFTLWIGETVDSVFKEEDENKVQGSDNEEQTNLLNGRTKQRRDSETNGVSETEGQGLFSMFGLDSLFKKQPVDNGKETNEELEEVDDYLGRNDYCKIRFEYDDYSTTCTETEASDSGAYMSEGRN